MMLKTNETHIATRQTEPIRLQEYGVGIFTTLNTKSALKKALKKNLILVNGKLATTATYIQGNETIVFRLPPETIKKKKLSLKLEIVFEDDFLAILNKPAGILVSGNTFKTVDNALVQNLKPSSQPDAVKPRPVHRLDFATTGLLLIGKTSFSISALNQLFAEKHIKKTYVAVVIGKLSKKGTITSPIDTKTAVTEYERIKTVVSKRFGYLNLVKLFPKTGRRHQLRKHLSALGNPILGDATYYQEGLLLKGKGLYLHAFSLEFCHPIKNERLYIERQPPPKFEKLFKSIS